MKELNNNQLAQVEGGSDIMDGVWSVVDGVGDFTIGILEGVTNGLFGWGYWN